MKNMEENAIRLFNTTVPLKGIGCSLNNSEPLKAEKPSVNLYVKLTNRCTADCHFCAFRNPNSEGPEFEKYKFYYAINQIKKVVNIQKVSFTGGEPTIVYKDLFDAVNIVREIDKNIFIVLSTNGLLLNDLNSTIDDYLTNSIDSIALSRHHYDDNINTKLFGIKNPILTFKDMEKLKFKDKIHLSCNLIKGFIDSSEETYKYINTFAEIGIEDFGFVTLMKTNQYATENHIDFDNVKLETMPNTVVNKEWKYGNDCKCKNYLTFTNTGKIVKLYARYYVNREKCDGTLVYDINKLRIGFTGTIIL